MATDNKRRPCSRPGCGHRGVDHAKSFPGEPHPCIYVSCTCVDYVATEHEIADPVIDSHAGSRGVVMQVVGHELMTIAFDTLREQLRSRGSQKGRKRKKAT